MMRGLIGTACAGALVVAALCVSTYAEASVAVGPARYTERATCGGSGTNLGADLFAPETVVNNGTNCYSEAATGSMGAAMSGPGVPDLGSPWARAILNTAGTNGGTTSATVDYDFGVGALPGGVPGANVPLVIHAYLFGEFSGTGNISDLTARITVGSSSYTRTACKVVGSDTVCDPFEFELVLPYSMLADGSPDFIEVKAIANGGGPLSMRAVADPIIEIDPSFADRALYEVVLSPGIAAPPTLPPPPTGIAEPAAMAIFGLGFATLGMMRRRRFAT